MSTTPKGRWSPFLVAVGAVVWLLGASLVFFMPVPANLIFGAFWLLLLFLLIGNYRRHGGIQPRIGK